MRVNAQLINTETDAHLWAERFDRDTGDLFALQSDITSRIAIALNLELIAADAAHPPGNPDASDCILRARATLATGVTLDNYAAAISLYERALALDPQSAEARGRLASALVGRVLDFEINSAASDLKRADELIAQALVRSPNSPVTHYAKAQSAGRAGP